MEMTHAALAALDRGSTLDNNRSAAELATTSLAYIVDNAADVSTVYITSPVIFATFHEIYPNSPWERCMARNKTFADFVIGLTTQSTFSSSSGKSLVNY